MGLRDEPFIRTLLARLPAQSRDSFNDDQLRALKVALGGQAIGDHAVDLRWSWKFWRRHYYFMLLGGRSESASSPRGGTLGNFARLVAMAGLLGTLLVFFVLALYLLKSALGIDLLPGVSLGVWDWFREVFSQ
ncbi:MAG: 3-phosphoshikimate 1-carboxyvinyltransferase [Betaproteobacteria bacterium]|nr:3-phosphoshikimate 1-carboxyvinyltransferase [Betaproteobacteria bacterium]